jgi:outer membrane translocation and assembly module TamA
VDHSNPVLSNFYGFGNGTMKDSLKPIPYYNARYDFISADVLIKKRFLNDSVMSFSIGPSIYNYWCDAEPNRNKVLEHPSMVGLDSGQVYSQKLYGGGKAVLTVRNLNSDLLPTRGVDWRTEFTALQGLNKNAKGLTRLVSNLNLYAVLSEPSKLLATIHIGGGHIFSDNYEYFQALTLGGDSYLRGYRANRFAGSTMAYGSAELKVKLFDFNAYVVKGDFGLVGFNDVGRVWVKNEASDKWHHGYGGGIYLVPFNTLMVSFVTAFSEEDQLFNLTLGTKLNMVFQGNNN